MITYPNAKINLGLNQKKNKQHADRLFQYVGKCRNRGILYPVVPSGYTTVNSTQWDTDGNIGKQLGTAFIEQKKNSNL